MGEFYVFRVEKSDLKQQKRPTCFARLLLNQWNSDVVRLTTHVVLRKVESFFSHKSRLYSTKTPCGSVLVGEH